MTTYSVRCRNIKCRHRRVTKTHPFDYKVVPKSESCSQAAGWRVESRAYNKRGLCYCGGPINLRTGMSYPHKANHPMCDQHSLGYYNQARARGVEDQDIPSEYRPTHLQDDFAFYRSARPRSRRDVRNNP
jgi:hypothetical protein